MKIIEAFFVTKLFILLFFAFFLASCQTVPNITPGIQPGFEAVNPAAIIAVPIFIMPDPSSETSSIDFSLLETEKLIPSLENKIIDSFNHQPNINGYPFSAVKKAINYNPPKVTTNLNDKSLNSPNKSPNEKEMSKPSVWDNLDKTMDDVTKRFSSRDTKTRLLISPNCLARKNYVEFYTYCLAGEQNWLTNLNLLSAQVLNADSALITVITDLQDKVVNKQYQVTGGLSVLLVDTNNGKLIWGNYKKETLVNSSDKKYFPSWDELLNKILIPDFWNGFPGRIGKNQLK